MLRRGSTSLFSLRGSSILTRPEPRRPPADGASRSSRRGEWAPARRSCHAASGILAVRTLEFNERLSPPAQAILTLRWRGRWKEGGLEREAVGRGEKGPGRGGRQPGVCGLSHRCSRTVGDEAVGSQPTGEQLGRGEGLAPPASPHSVLRNAPGPWAGWAPGPAASGDCSSFR